MEDDRAKFILEIASLDERRIALTEYALDLAVTQKSLVRQETDGFAYRKHYEWAKGELKVVVELSHTDAGNDHVDVRVYELDWLVFHVSAVQRVNQRKRVMQRAFLHRDVESYWEAMIRYAKP